MGIGTTIVNSGQASIGCRGVAYKVQVIQKILVILFQMVPTSERTGNYHNLTEVEVTLLKSVNTFKFKYFTINIQIQGLSSCCTLKYYEEKLDIHLLRITLSMKITVFWDEILCSLVPIHQTTCFPIPEGNNLPGEPQISHNKLWIWTYRLTIKHIQQRSWLNDYRLWLLNHTVDVQRSATF